MSWQTRAWARTVGIASSACCDNLSSAARRHHASFSYQAAGWTKARRVVAKVDWHPGELYPRVGFIVTNLSRPADRVIGFCNQRGAAEKWIKESKTAIKWNRLSCKRFKANAVRLQLHALAYNLGNFMRTLALPGSVSHWSLTTLRERFVKIGAKVVRHGRYVVFRRRLSSDGDRANIDFVRGRHAGNPSLDMLPRELRQDLAGPWVLGIKPTRGENGNREPTVRFAAPRGRRFL